MSKIRCYKQAKFRKHANDKGQMEWANVMTTTNINSAEEWMARQKQPAFFVIENPMTCELQDVPWMLKPQAPKLDEEEQ